MNHIQPEKPAKRRTEPRDVRRKQLILAAMDSISKRGFSDTTLRHVTEKANLSHGVVNYHFASKEALYDATMEYLAREYYDLWTKNLDAAPADPKLQLTAIIASDFDKKICGHKKIAVWFAFWGQAKYRPNYLKISNVYDEERFEKIQEICVKLIKEGAYPDLSAESATRTIECLSDGLWLSMMLYPSVTKPTQCLDDFMQALAGLFPKHFTGTQVIQDNACDVST
ncbi:MAG: TetR/AcrR family bet gene transcriptional repressor [Paracoccaceae bacterium]|jgi:TetR/AcrR family transcriptional repressor of bet genes